MSIEDVAIVTKRNRRSKTHHGSPRNPEMVSKIIEWRDKHMMTWQAIGDELNMTRAGARHLYQKWRSWSGVTYKEEE
jgi:hypothetical protein